MSTTTTLTCARCGEVFGLNEGTGRQCPKCGTIAPDSAAVPNLDVLPPLPPPPIAPPPPFAPPPVPGQSAGSGGAAAAARAAQVLEYSRNMSLSWLDRAKKAMAKHVRDIPVSTAEQDRLAAQGIHDPSVQRHFVWRRSLLWFIVVPTTFTAVMGTINLLKDGFDSLTTFGVLMSLLYTASLWAIPAAVALAARLWDRPKRSRRVLLLGFYGSFVFILLLALLPFHWWIKMEIPDDPTVRAQMQQGLALFSGIFMMLYVLPAILSLLPGAIRACVRIKVLFPESIVSGWLLITVAPLYALFVLALFILVNQAAGNFLLILGFACLVAAPVTYLVRTPLFIRPAWTEPDRAQIARAQWVYIIILAGAGAMLMLYALSVKVMDRPVVGFDSSGAMIGVGSFVWHSFKFLMDYIGRSLFITSLAMDYFLLVNVSVWQNTRQFEQTDHATEYERTITELGTVLTRD